MPWHKPITDYIKGTERMKRYVSTIILNEALTKCVVIRKDHGPTHLIGKLNAVGGLIEPGESLFAAAVREIKEESNLVIDKRMLDLLGNLSDTDYSWDIACFVVTLSDAEIAKAKTLTSEKIELWSVPLLLASADLDQDCKHLIYEALRAKSKQLLYDGSRGIRFSSS